MRIFVVENHPDTLGFICRYLLRLGHEVESARTMNEALQRLPEKPRDVLLADLGLPDGDGWTLLEQLGSARPILAIAISGSGTPADRARSQSVGFQVHLVKPFSPRELRQVLPGSDEKDLVVGPQTLPTA